jgi:hypothetical protein
MLNFVLSKSDSDELPDLRDLFRTPATQTKTTTSASSSGLVKARSSEVIVISSSSESDAEEPLPKAKPVSKKSAANRRSSVLSSPLRVTGVPSKRSVSCEIISDSEKERESDDESIIEISSESSDDDRRPSKNKSITSVNGNAKAPPPLPSGSATSQTKPRPRLLYPTAPSSSGKEREANKQPTAESNAARTEANTPKAIEETRNGTTSSHSGTRRRLLYPTDPTNTRTPATTSGTPSRLNSFVTPKEDPSRPRARMTAKAKLSCSQGKQLPQGTSVGESSLSPLGKQPSNAPSPLALHDKRPTSESFDVSRSLDTPGTSNARPSTEFIPSSSPSDGETSESTADRTPVHSPTSPLEITANGAPSSSRPLSGDVSTARAPPTHPRTARKSVLSITGDSGPSIAKKSASSIPIKPHFGTAKKSASITGRESLAFQAQGTAQKPAVSAQPSPSKVVNGAPTSPPPSSIPPTGPISGHQDRSKSPLSDVASLDSIRIGSEPESSARPPVLRKVKLPDGTSTNRDSSSLAALKAAVHRKSRKQKVPRFFKLLGQNVLELTCGCA